MTNQMKKVLLACLICSYAFAGGLFLILIINGFAFLYIVNYFLLVIDIGLAVYFNILYVKIKQKDLAFENKLFYAKKLLELRDRAVLDFYVRRGIIPQFDKKGKLIDPDTLIGILTKLDAEGKLTDSIYEMLGIEPKFDKYGREIPVIVVLKHLMGKPRTKDFDKLKKFAKLKTKPNEKATEIKKTEKKVAAKQKASEGGRSYYVQPKPVKAFAKPLKSKSFKKSKEPSQYKSKNAPIVEKYVTIKQSAPEIKKENIIKPVIINEVENKKPITASPAMQKETSHDNLLHGESIFE